MERESFEDSEVAIILNKHFICIKIDREERPDVDHIYMNACQALTGHGGWPLTVFLTPDKKPFFAGTYFPKQSRMGMPGLINILSKITQAWESNRQNLYTSAMQLSNAISQSQVYRKESPNMQLLHDAFASMKAEFDGVYGGFGDAPKFPSPHNLFFLLRYWYRTGNDSALEMVEKTLEGMFRGGMYDHLGFGFSRYSTDERWLVPHFEKMLYDNALLTVSYLETYQVTGKKLYADVANQVLTYVLRDMTDPEGGFYSAEDADSEGVEGKFYVWAPEEVMQALGEIDGKRFCEVYDITNQGNFEEKNIPNLIRLGRWQAVQQDAEFFSNCLKKLFQQRESRIHPFKDDKILTAWNGLMIAAMAMAGRVLKNNTYTAAAEKATAFIENRLVSKDNGRLLARYRDGEAHILAFLDDYAFFIWGLLELYETTFNLKYLQMAIQYSDSMSQLFEDNEDGGFFLYGNDSEELITRPKDAYDGAIPSGNSVAALNFLRLARLTGRHELEEKANRIIHSFAGLVRRAPRAFTNMLNAILYSLTPAREIVLVSQQTGQMDNIKEFIAAVQDNFHPFTATLRVDESKAYDLEKIAPFASGYKAVESKPTAYVCENYSCREPITDITDFKELLSSPAQLEPPSFQ